MPIQSLKTSFSKKNSVLARKKCFKLMKVVIKVKKKARHRKIYMLIKVTIYMEKEGQEENVYEDLDDALGCTEIWEKISKKRRED